MIPVAGHNAPLVWKVGRRVLLDLVIYLGVGAISGVLAGLFGIGGGLVIVPALIFSFGLHGVPASVATHLAVGSSLAIIIVTSISAVRGHYRRGAVQWPLVRRMSPAILAGVWLGAWLAGQLSGAHLQLIIGVFALLIALQMGFDLKPGAAGQLPGRAGLSAAGGVIGAASAVFGIGGGSLTVPFLTWRGVDMLSAVATSAACGLPIAAGGALAYLWQGWGHPDLPTWSAGYLYGPACLGVALASAPFARLGVRLAHRWPPQLLKRLFAVLLAVVGIRFIFFQGG